MSTDSDLWRTQWVPCNLCGRPDGQTLWLKEGFRYVQCPECGLVYVNPQLLHEQIARIYEIGYDSKVSATLGGADALSYRRLLATARRYKQTGWWLDVGCFKGSLLFAARAMGWQPHGTEISAPAAEYARNQGIQMHEGSLLDANYAADAFDIVTMNDVIEHVDQPLEYIRETWRILRPGGMLYIETPNFDSLTRHCLGKDWSVFFPWHQYYFTPTTLTAMLMESRFQMQRIECVGMGPVRRGNAVRSLAHSGQIARGGRQLKVRRWVRRRVPGARRWFFFVRDSAVLPMRALSSVGIHLGSKMIVIAEKPVQPVSH